MIHRQRPIHPICAGDWVIYKKQRMVVIGVIRQWDTNGSEKVGYYCRGRRGQGHFVRGSRQFSAVVYVVRGAEARGDLSKPGSVARVADRYPLERNPLADDDWAGLALPKADGARSARLELTDRSHSQTSGAGRDTETQERI